MCVCVCVRCIGKLCLAALPWLTLIAGALVPESPGELRGAGGVKLNKHYMSGVFTLRAAVSVLPFICSTITLRPPGEPRGAGQSGEGLPVMRN